MKKTGMILLILIILIFNFIIGANEKGLRVLPISILLALIIIYLVIKKIKEPKHSVFFQSKIDYLVLLFMFTTTLPCIFKTYCSYSDTIEFILKYFFIYSVYVLARNVITEKKDINHLITATLICSLVPIILGLDIEYFNCLEWIREDLNLLYGESESFYSTFGYANAVAIYMSLCLFLAIHKIKNTENKITKAITIIYILLISYIMWITKTRIVIALVLMSVLAYLLIENRKMIIENPKKSLIIFFLILIVGIPLMIYAINISKPVFIDGPYYKQRIEYDFKANTLYKLELDVESSVKAKAVKDTAFELQIIQANKYFVEGKIAKMRFGETNGKVAIEFTPEEGYSYIKIRILNDFAGTINIKHCYINDKEYILEYKYVPKQLGQIFSQYRLNQKSIKERIYIYSDCIKIAKEHLILGSGGNTWKVISPAVEEYKTLLKETHSYFFELLINYGIIGVLAFFAFVLLFFVKIIKQLKNNKEKREEKLLIFIGLFIVLIHGITFDFDMSFMLIQLMIYIYVAALLYDEHNNEKIPKTVDYVLILFLAFILSIYIRADIAKYMVEDNYTKYNILPYSKNYGYNTILDRTEKEGDNVAVLKDIQRFINREPYYNQTEVYELYLNQMCNNIEKLSNKEISDYSDFIINKLKTIKFKTPLFIETIIPRTKTIKDAVNKLKEYELKLENDSETKKVVNHAINGLEEILESEYEKHIYNIEARDRTGETEYDANMIKKEYLEILGKE